ncbi:UNVERIFIED_CONTAM: hypothetical protein Scaly_2666700, partial [Sesamum calycinum]
LFEAPSVPQVSEEPTPAGHVEGNYPQYGDEQYIDWAQRMVFYAVELSYFASSHEGVLDDDQPLWDGCTQSQLGVVAELVDIKADCHISEQIYDKISQWANRILPSGHILSGDYYSTKKLNIRTCHKLSIHDAGGIDVDCERPTRLWNGVWVEYHGVYGMSDLSKKAFMKNHIENKVARLRLSRDQILDRVINISPEIEMPLSLLDGYGSDHKWTKKNIFWDLLYWSTLLIQHNLDVMHIEKNVFDNIFKTVMDINGKMKDNMNARRDLKIIYNRPELELDERKPNVMPKAVYTLGKEQKRRIAFREILLEHVWSGLIEVSLLLQSTYSTTLDVHKLHELENSIAIIMCNLEKIFPPAFFDSMGHLIVHLPYEAHVGRPVQYRWMYPFERFLLELKKVKTKEHVEASIVEVYIVQEIGMFTSQYFESDVHSKRSMPRRNDECTSSDDGI